MRRRLLVLLFAFLSLCIECVSPNDERPCAEPGFQPCLRPRTGADYLQIWYSLSYFSSIYQLPQKCDAGRTILSPNKKFLIRGYSGIFFGIPILQANDRIELTNDMRMSTNQFSFDERSPVQGQCLEPFDFKIPLPRSGIVCPIRDPNTINPGESYVCRVQQNIINPQFFVQTNDADCTIQVIR